jgi:hypothetical protein
MVCRARLIHCPIIRSWHHRLMLFCMEQWLVAVSHSSGDALGSLWCGLLSLAPGARLGIWMTGDGSVADFALSSDNGLLLQILI